MTLRAPSFPGLEVLPYVRGRLVFAQAAASAVEQGGFECVAVDLPRFLKGGGFLDVPLQRFPLVTSLLISEGDGDCMLLPFVPTDAPMIAAYLARTKAIEVDCIDDPRLSASDGAGLLRPEVELQDECLAEALGAGEYFRPVWDAMEAAWDKAPPSVREAVEAWAGRAAARLDELLAKGRRVLFVCECQLWWAVQRRPQRRDRRNAGNKARNSRPAALIFEDPGLLWATGRFDDFPAVNRLFFESVLSAQARAFDKRAALDTVVAGRLPHSDLEPVRPLQLLEEATGRLGEPAARAIAKDLLDYPQAKASDADQLLPAYLQVTSDTVVEAHDHFSLADVFHARPYYDATSVERGRFLTAQEQVDRQRWLAALRPFVTRQEAKLLTRGVGGMVRWAVKSDYQLHQRVCALLRGMAQSTGLDEFTPVAFVFTSSTEGNHSSCVHDSNITQRGMELGDATLGGSVRLEPDMVYSLFSTVSGRETPFPPHLERDCLTTLALLFTGVSMGLERYASITARPKKLQCRVPPESDSELAGFGLAERGLAWCVKWATDAVIAAVHPGWEPSGKLLEFAQKRRVEILRIGLDALPEATVRRLQQMHYTSTSLKRHPDSETIVQRFTAPDGLERSENGGQESK